MENTKKEIRQKFFEQFGESSFRGYPLEQCYLILEFFEPYLSSLPSTEERKTAEEIQEKWYQAYKNSTTLSRFEAMNSAMLEYASQQTEAMAKEIEELKKEDAETDELCKKILNGKGTVYVRGLESQLSDAKKEIEVAEQEADNLNRELIKVNAELSAMRERVEKLTDALNGIEKSVDNQNPTHENIWRIAYSALQSLNPTKKDQADENNPN